MCVNPRVLDSGLLVSCRECWQCRETYISDWAGRCTAESQDAVATHLVTLTYGGGDHVDARVLNYQHVRTYLRAIRDSGHAIRYFCVGEYGSTKARAHWHLLLFWQNTLPKIQDGFMPPEAKLKNEIRLDWSCEQMYWPHGHSKYEVAEHQAARYVMKYMQKDFRDAENHSEYGMSTKPMLGYRFFARQAQLYVDAQLAPQDRIYRIPDVRNKRNNQLTEFYMSRNVWLYFCQTYLDAWYRAYPGRHRPTSPILDDYEDLIAKRARPDPLQYPPQVRAAQRPWIDPRSGRRYRDGDIEAPVGWNSVLQLYFYPAELEAHIPVLYWTFDGEGRPSWQKDIVTAAQAENRRAVSELRKESVRSYRDQSKGW